MKTEPNICTFKNYLQFSIYNEGVIPTYTHKREAVTGNDRKKSKSKEEEENDSSLCPQVTSKTEVKG